MASSSVTGYSVGQRILHWSMALLIFFNLIFSDGMEHWRRLVATGQTVTADDVWSANIHAYVGIAVLALFALRLALRFIQGVPKDPENEPAIAKIAGRVAHVSFYILFLIMPLSGIGAYYFGYGQLGDLHAEVLKVVLWVLIAGHVAAALLHQFYWKTNVLTRMTRG